MSKFGIKRTTQSETDLERLHIAFQRLDKNNDGTIDIEEFAAALNPNVKVKAFLQHDENNDGKIDFQEFVQYAERHQDKLRLHFDTMDMNQDGKIEVEEVVAVFKRLGTNMNKEDAKKLLDKMDKDGDYTIDWAEWRDYLLLTPCDNLEDLLQHWKRSTIIDIGENGTIPDDFTEYEKEMGLWWRYLLAGSYSGIISRTFTAPLDRFKLLYQARSKSDGKLTLLDLYRHCKRDGGFRSLYQGNGVNVSKIIPEAVSKFLIYEKLKEVIAGKDHVDITMAQKFMAGSLAGAFSQSVVYPLEVVKTKLVLAKPGQYRGILDCFKTAYKSQGLRIFYRGYAPSMIAVMPYSGIDLAVYETLRGMFKHIDVDDERSILVTVMCGTTSCTCGQIASYPLSLLRTKLVAEVPLPGQRRSRALDMTRKIWREEGIRGFYRGVAPNFIKIVPAVCLSYYCYDLVKFYLGLPTH